MARLAQNLVQACAKNGQAWVKNAEGLQYARATDQSPSQNARTGCGARNLPGFAQTPKSASPPREASGQRPIKPDTCLIHPNVGGLRPSVSGQRPMRPQTFEKCQLRQAFFAWLCFFQLPEMSGMCGSYSLAPGFLGVRLGGRPASARLSPARA